MRKSQPRAVDPRKEIERLEKKHSYLKERVHEIDSRSFLSAEEQLEVAELKKKKLSVKDEIEEVRRSYPPELQTG
jgi:hypothetical protein